MSLRPIIIWGAGRIGRGFIAEAFDTPAHQLVLVDIASALVRQLNAQGRYTIFHADATGIHETTISGYVAFEAEDTQALMPYFLRQQPIISVAGFASKVPELAQMMSAYVRQRARQMPSDPIDFVLSINMMHPEHAFRAALCEALSNDPVALAYVDENVGIVPSVVMCITPDAPKEILSRDPLAIYNNNFPELIVGAIGLKGAPPVGLPKLRLSMDIDAEETRKIYSLNMVHAAASYLSMGAGHTYIAQAVRDEHIRPLLRSALEESAVGLSGEFGFSVEQMQQWNQHMLALLENPHIGDDLVRLGSDSSRKLGPDDRLVGAARLCIKHGGRPLTIARAIRRGFDYEHADEGTEWVQRIVKIKGLEAAMQQVSELSPDEPLYSMILASEC